MLLPRVGHGTVQRLTPAESPAQAAARAQQPFQLAMAAGELAGDITLFVDRTAANKRLERDIEVRKKQAEIAEKGFVNIDDPALADQRSRIETQFADEIEDVVDEQSGTLQRTIPSYRALQLMAEDEAAWQAANPLEGRLKQSIYESRLAVRSLPSLTNKYASLLRLAVFMLRKQQV